MKEMVRLHIKKGDESQFLFDTTVDSFIDNVINDITVIYNGRLKIFRICYGKHDLQINNNNVSLYLYICIYVFYFFMLI